jgi:hypothetical protein
VDCSQRDVSQSGVLATRRCLNERPVVGHPLRQARGGVEPHERGGELDDLVAPLGEGIDDPPLEGGWARSSEEITLQWHDQL